MDNLERNILDSFKKQMGEEVKDLELMVAFNEDTWPDEDHIYQAEVMETKNNGRVWGCECTRNGRVKDTYEI